jgi:ketosteroid isomerase-like protein
MPVAGCNPEQQKGGRPISIDGKYMTILERQADGSWKIHRDIFNSNTAPRSSR